MSPELITFFTAMTPLLELKLAIPLGRELGLSAITTILFAVAGSIVPAALILWLTGPIINYLERKSKIVHKFCIKFLEKTQQEHSKKFARYGAVFLIVLVATPLPGSGAGTGALVAFIFGIDQWKAFTLILIGTSLGALLVSGGVQSLTSLIHFIKP